MKEFETVIFMEPVAKGRARLAVVAGHAKAYTPKKTVNAEAQVIAQIRNEIGPHGIMFDAGVPLSLSATFYIARPKSAPKRVTMPTTRPDADNLGKMLLDALNGFAFHDDAQLTSVLFRKRFCLSWQVPRIEFRIKEENDGETSTSSYH